MREVCREAGRGREERRWTLLLSVFEVEEGEAGDRGEEGGDGGEE